MVKHLVFWKLKPRAAGRRAAENAREIQKRIEALQGRIPGLLRIEAGVDTSRTGASADLALYSEFSDQAALEAYQIHPEHQAVVAFIGELVESRQVVDYLVPEPSAGKFAGDARDTGDN
ncbi:Stress responsive A/B Barrel Domain [Alkalispirochaeta americana]|uniref:Stress responsive A/B Barrel Domain n=1 Tax=Alkalispirochaeta americana TaxID=159291 RepID=A0A1N6N9G4_9SPIO|nr:Dabb family protein [Alkalispirochaeta americana]SIP88696.1 Stress responsive A/B Barrel Domain [Alkalispirochaeta americana]